MVDAIGLIVVVAIIFGVYRFGEYLSSKSANKGYSGPQSSGGGNGGGQYDHK